MELSSSVLRDLAQCPASRDELKRCLDFVGREVGVDEAVGDDVSQNKIFANFAAALLICFAEAARRSANEATLRTALAEIGLSTDQLNAISQKFNLVRDKMILELQDTNFSYPKLVDVHWRLDYSVRSGDIGRDNRPVSFVRLTFKQGHRVRHEDIMCTEEQLQDWVAKSTDAMKQIDRLNSGGELTRKI